MEKISFYKKIRNYFLKGEKNLSSNHNNDYNETYGFQLNHSDLDDYLNRYLSDEQKRMFLNRINFLGYLSYDVGQKLKDLFNNSSYDLYVKTVHSSQIHSIFSEGIRCLGKSSSLNTTNPTSVSEVNLDNTITKVDDFPSFIFNIKCSNGLSQGSIQIDGTIILQIPKGIEKTELLYFNEITKTFNINPSYIVGFLPVDSKNVVSDFIYPDKSNKKNYK